ncbi:MAG: GTP-binding protein [Oscillospiraceae bacterium]|nr:GTP-binding protein [Oscillospiraceae bacterium]
MKKRLCAGLLAHVDAGKTTLSEALLYQAGALKKLGRVDHRDSFLDTNALERERGITIFSKQARLETQNLELILLDTPGHTDFSTEMERTLQALDYAVLVVSGTDGVQAHTETLWQLLRRYHIPTFLFINKMDLPGEGEGALMAKLKKQLSEGCVSFCQEKAALLEEAALCDEIALEVYLQSGKLPEETLAELIQKERLFPCFFGSALKLNGISELLSALERLTVQPSYPEEFAAKAYKIARDPQGNRLTYLKVTGGCLKVRAMLAYTLPSGERVEEKVKELRRYSGLKYQQAEEIMAGEVCAVLGLTRTAPGQCFGTEAQGQIPVLEPVMTFGLRLPKGCDPARFLPKLKQLEEEDPQLHIVWDSRLGEIQVQLMGQVQIEIFKSLVRERFETEIDIGKGRVLYKETIASTVEGVGHFEPLRHYAEVHLLLEPLPKGSGLVFASNCVENTLDLNWQRLILTHLEEKQHLGVLTGAPITDMKITLVSGRAHLKHTEGGDFRQATYRAVRQGLMQAKNVLLEPYYNFRLTVPTQQLGRAITDIKAMSGDFAQPVEENDETVLTGSVPVAALGDYANQVAAYTHGRGRLSCLPGGYAPCAEAEKVIAAMDYDPESDLENTPDSVFCAHGAGFNVKWREVPNYMHLESCLRPVSSPEAPRLRPQNLNLDEKELEAIMEREFGPIRRPVYQPPTVRFSEGLGMEPAPAKKEYLIVDGYNMIFAWEDLAALAKEDLESARRQLMDMLASYSAYKRRETILVFDGYKVKGNRGERFRQGNLSVVYTKENETGDLYIEAMLEGIGKNERVWVATSDSLIQISALRTGVLRMSARELRQEIESAGGEMTALMKAMENAGKMQNLADRRREWRRILQTFEEKQGK